MLQEENPVVTEEKQLASRYEPILVAHSGIIGQSDL